MYATATTQYPHLIRQCWNQTKFHFRRNFQSSELLVLQENIAVFKITQLEYNALLGQKYNSHIQNISLKNRIYLNCMK